MALDIGIIGAGTAGCAAATVLARDGHDVTLYERAPTPGPVGAGLLMQPSGLGVLTRLGLDGPVRESGARIDQLRCVTAGGKHVYTLAYRDLGADLHGIGLHRGVLFSTLFAAAQRSGARVATGVTAARLIGVGRKKLVLCDDGAQHGPHDLVVVASGSRNTVADEEPPVRRAIAYPWGALWFVATIAAPEPELFQVVSGTRRMLGILPIAKDLATVFWSIPVDARESAPASMAAELALHHPPASALLVTPPRVLFASYTDVRMPRWDVGPVVYIGDAGHGMSPQLGQGANLALIDAETLGACLRRAPDLPSALGDYSRRRRPLLHYYQFVTRWLTPFFQSHTALLGPARDIMMGPLTRIPPLRRLMLRSMAGFDGGTSRNHPR